MQTIAAQKRNEKCISQLAVPRRRRHRGILVGLEGLGGLHELRIKVTTPLALTILQDPTAVFALLPALDVATWSGVVLLLFSLCACLFPFFDVFLRLLALSVCAPRRFSVLFYFLSVVPSSQLSNRH